MCRARRAENGGAEADDDNMSVDEDSVAAQAPKSKVLVDPTATDLRHFHPANTSFDIVPRGDFTVVRRMKTGIHGDVYKYTWRPANAGENSNVVRPVAVKKFRREAVAHPAADVERDERKAFLRLGGRRCPCPEDALAEIGVLHRLSKQPDLPVYILKMLGLYRDISHVWLVTEFADGGELFGQVESEGPLPEPRAMRYTWQIFQAIAFLHRHGIGHRDLSLENILLHGGSVRVMDFGMAVQSRASCGVPLRYFREVGKNFYRAPECYVPQADFVDIIAPADAKAGDVATAEVNRTYLCEVLLQPGVQPNAPSRAQTYGYTAEPADVFAVGVCLFIMLTGCPAWREANLRDEHFEYTRTKGILELRRTWGLPDLNAELAEVLLGALAPESSNRMTADECLARPWFAEFAGVEVERHSADMPMHPLALTMAGA